MILDILSIPIQYVKALVTRPQATDGLFLYVIDEYNVFVLFQQNWIFIQNETIAYLDQSSPLQSAITCDNPSRYVVFDQTKLVYTLYCGQNESFWDNIKMLNPYFIPIQDVIEWKKRVYPEDQRLLIQHIINYLYSNGWFKITKKRLFKI